MWIDAHGNLTMVPPGGHHCVATAEPGVVPGLGEGPQAVLAQRVPAVTVGGNGEVDRRRAAIAGQNWLALPCVGGETLNCRPDLIISSW
jgi:hypothetical protein